MSQLKHKGDEKSSVFRPSGLTTEWEAEGDEGKTILQPSRGNKKKKKTIRNWREPQG